MERGEQRRIQRDVLDAGLVRSQSIHADDLGWVAFFRRLLRIEHDANDRPLVIAVARDEGNCVAADRELSRALDARAFGIAQVVQPVDQLSLAKGLAPVELQRSCVHAWQHTLALAVQPQIDLPAEQYPVIAGDADAEERADGGQAADDEPGLARDADDEPADPSGRAASAGRPAGLGGHRGLAARGKRPRAARAQSQVST